VKHLLHFLQQLPPPGKSLISGTSSRGEILSGIQTIRRNAERFSVDFVSGVTREKNMGISQFVISSQTSSSAKMFILLPKDSA